jgi:hypothetical protein
MATTTALPTIKPTAPSTAVGDQTTTLHQFAMVTATTVTTTKNLMAPPLPTQAEAAPHPSTQSEAAPPRARFRPSRRIHLRVKARTRAKRGLSPKHKDALRPTLPRGDVLALRVERARVRSPFPATKKGRP